MLLLLMMLLLFSSFPFYRISAESLTEKCDRKWRIGFYFFLHGRIERREGRKIKRKERGKKIIMKKSYCGWM